MLTGEVDLDVLLVLPYGLYIVSSMDDGRYTGHLSNSVVQVTDSPPRIAVTVSKKNLTCDYIIKSNVFSVSVLDQNTPFRFLGRFGFKSGRKIDKFADVQYQTGKTGCPLVTENSIAAIEARIINQVDVYTHVIFIGEVVCSELLRTGQPMTYAYYRQTLRGKTPPNAPSYQKKVEPKAKKVKPVKQGAGTMKKYKCLICDYVYDPEVGDPEGDIAVGTTFENLPDDWICPECGADKSEFEEVDE